MTGLTIIGEAGSEAETCANNHGFTFEAIVETSGTCGENLAWRLDGGILSITGTGAMTDYNWGEAPWYSDGESITAVQIENGVASIGNSAFDSCSNLTGLVIPGYKELLDSFKEEPEE